MSVVKRPPRAESPLHTARQILRPPQIRANTSKDREINVCVLHHHVPMSTHRLSAVSECNVDEPAEDCAKPSNSWTPHQMRWPGKWGDFGWNLIGGRNFHGYALQILQLCFKMSGVWLPPACFARR
jgi:hypothetical protein